MASPYIGKDGAVHFDKSLCTECHRCIQELPQVFNLTPPAHTPWVNMEGASTEQIIKQVNRCESGALTWEWPSE